MTSHSAVPGTIPVVLLTVVTALSIIGCAGSSSDTSPTVSALSAAASPAPSASDSAALSWTAVSYDTAGNMLSDLAGYEIHYGTSEDALTNLIVVGAQQTSYTIPGLPAGTWYFSVNAYTSNGIEGLPSNIASKTIN